MAVNNSLQSRSGGKPKFSVAIQTPMYQKLVNDTLGDPDRAQRFVAAISSAVADVYKRQVPGQLALDGEEQDHPKILKFKRQA